MTVKISRYPKRFGVLTEPRITFTIVESVSIDYNMSWESIPVYGRQDAIQSYKTTGQSLSVQVATEIAASNIGGKEFTDVEYFRFILKTLNSLSRPVYEGDVIAQSPLWRVQLFTDIEGVGQGYATGQNDVIIAPQSLGVDYGDRIRKIDALRAGNLADVDFGDIADAVPKRLAINFSGPIINTKPVFISRGRTTADSSAPLVDSGTPQAKAKTTKNTKK